jgi:four helix bundle protein
MNSDDLKERTKIFGLRTIKFVEKLSNNKTPDILVRQLIRSATSVGANYRAACLARSRADFAFKISIVAEEADESAFWLELLLGANLINGQEVRELMCEANELTAIFVASGRTAKLK